MPGQGAPVTNYGVVAQAASAITPISDNAQGTGSAFRLASRGEQVAINIWNGMHSLAMEGSYWVASTATPGTGIAISVTTGTTFSDTQALICLNNTDTLGGKTIYLDFITMVITTVPTSATSVHLAHRVDAVNRGTAGTQLGANLVAPRPSNMNFAGTAIGQCFALGASAVSVAAASATVRNLGRNVLRSQIPVIQDQYTIKFGAVENASSPNIGATTAQNMTFYAPPIAIGPQQSYVCNEWAVARSAATSGELIVGWVER